MIYKLNIIILVYFNVYLKLIFRLRCENTIETRIKDLQDKKLQLSHEILTGSAQNGIKLGLQDIEAILNM